MNNVYIIAIAGPSCAGKTELFKKAGHRIGLPCAPGWIAIIAI